MLFHINVSALFCGWPITTKKIYALVAPLILTLDCEWAESGMGWEESSTRLLPEASPTRDVGGKRSLFNVPFADLQNIFQNIVKRCARIFSGFENRDPQPSSLSLLNLPRQVVVEWSVLVVRRVGVTSVPVLKVVVSSPHAPEMTNIYEHLSNIIDTKSGRCEVGMGRCRHSIDVRARWVIDDRR
ncbi:hypothetical protein BD410DRAFT_103900 [Rickenella mellea]|uniref:Uncharacterized protein n=1 Tax=Rickenella mellea TaxID=50990 RepID=A0A4Y7PKL6_9AGAM|nr:hypothetical protein BD410DRAFT_103900 [Rickenella mellea]